MLATMGRIMPGITGKLPVYFSRPASLKVADIPCGLDAVSQASAAGCVQLVALGLFSQTQPADGTAAAGD
eukprot:6444702-Pyramimonas_sp.AAC.1